MPDVFRLLLDKRPTKCLIRNGELLLKLGLGRVPIRLRIVTAPSEQINATGQEERRKRLPGLLQTGRKFPDGTVSAAGDRQYGITNEFTTAIGGDATCDQHRNFHHRSAHVIDNVRQLSRSSSDAPQTEYFRNSAVSAHRICGD